MYTRLIIRIACLLFVCCNIIEVEAQSDFEFTQRWLNEILYNPAATGHNLSSNIFAHTRQQWAGLDGAPSTIALTADTYIRRLNSAFGIVLLGDKVGYLSMYSGKITCAYLLPLSRHSTLSFGMGLGVLNRGIVLDQVPSEQANDPLLLQEGASEYSFDSDFGLEYKGPVRVGASIRHVGIKQSARHWPFPAVNFWVYASGRLNLLSQLSVEPIFSFGHRNGFNQFEAGLILYSLKDHARRQSHDRFWIGGIYRIQGVLVVLAGMQITPYASVGYSLDYGVSHSLSCLSKFGTHEIFFAWKFNRLFRENDNCPACVRRRQGL